MQVQWPVKLQIAHGVISGMNFLHTRTPPIIHGDLKVESVLVGEEYIAKVYSHFSFAFTARGRQYKAPFWLQREGQLSNAAPMLRKKFCLFTARCYTELGYATVSRLSVRLSVCPPVLETLRFWRFHTGWNTSKIISRPSSLMHLLTLTQHGRSGATGTPQN